MTANYEQQANDFLEKTGAKIDIQFSNYGKHFDDDKENRDIYNVTITRGNRKFSFKFGNSLNDSGFYFTVGRKHYDLDRKYLESKNLVFVCKQIDCSFTPTCKADIIHKPVKPNNYDILCCLTKYDPGSFDNFCSEFGYDTDSKKAEKTYNAVLDEYKNVCALFTDDEINELSEIQ